MRGGRREGRNEGGMKERMRKEEILFPVPLSGWINTTLSALLVYSFRPKPKRPQVKIK